MHKIAAVVPFRLMLGLLLVPTALVAAPPAAQPGDFNPPNPEDLRREARHRANLERIAKMPLAPLEQPRDTDPPRQQPAGRYPRQITTGVNSWNHARWPVRVQRFTHIAWRAPCGKFAGMPMPEPTGKRVYVMGNDGALHLIDGRNGRVLWAVHGVKGRPNHSSSVMTAGEISMGSSFHGMRAVDSHGRCLWRTALGAGCFHSLPTLSPTGARLFAGANRLGLACLDTTNGKELWRYRPHTSGPSNHYCFDPLGNVIVQLPDELVCLDGKGKKRWSLPQRLAGMMLVGPRLICHQDDQVMNHHLDAMEWRWKKTVGGGVAGLALGAGNSIVCALDTGELLALDTTGKELWRARISKHGLLLPVTTIDGEVVVQDRGGFVHLYSPLGRKLLARVATKPRDRWYRPVIDPWGRVLLSHQDAVLCLAGGRPRPKPVTKVHIVADDFVVDIWVNGKLVPDNKRRLLAEIHGATAEVIQTRLKRGDWIVFNVVNNRMRWGGASYFGACGMDQTGDVRFCSTPEKAWFACDDPSKATAFITARDTGKERAVAPQKPWADASRIWRDTIHTTFPGKPVWGRKRNTWIKHVVQ